MSRRKIETILLAAALCSMIAFRAYVWQTTTYYQPETMCLLPSDDSVAQITREALPMKFSRAALPYTTCANLTRTSLSEPNVTSARQEWFSVFYKKIDDVFKRNSIPYWLERGSLIGWARECSVLDLDHDIDIGVWYHHYSSQLETDLKQELAPYFSKFRERGCYAHGPNGTNVRCHQRIAQLEGNYDRFILPDRIDIFLWETPRDPTYPKPEREIDLVYKPIYTCNYRCPRFYYSQYHWGVGRAQLAGVEVLVPYPWLPAVVSRFTGDWVVSDKQTPPRVLAFL